MEHKESKGLVESHPQEVFSELLDPTKGHYFAPKTQETILAPFVDKTAEEDAKKAKEDARDKELAELKALVQQLLAKK
jgi:hypothetical protein